MQKGLKNGIIKMLKDAYIEIENINSSSDNEFIIDVIKSIIEHKDCANLLSKLKIYLDPIENINDLYISDILEDVITKDNAAEIIEKLADIKLIKKQEIIDGDDNDDLYPYLMFNIFSEVDKHSDSENIFKALFSLNAIKYFNLNKIFTDNVLQDKLMQYQQKALKETNVGDKKPVIGLAFCDFAPTVEAFTKMGAEVKIFDKGTNPKDFLSGIDGLIIPGSPDSLCNYNPSDARRDSNKEHHSTQYLFNLAQSKGMPVFGICFGAQFIAKNAGADIEKLKDEKGITVSSPVTFVDNEQDFLLSSKNKVSSINFVRNNHNDFINPNKQSEERLRVLATDNNNIPKIIAIDYPRSRIWGPQFHPEYLHGFSSPDHGYNEATLKHFLDDACNFSKHKENQQGLVNYFCR